MARKVPQEADVFAGSQLRAARNRVGMSQEKLGEALGVTFQQIQKYEKGTNRMGSSRLAKCAEVLGVPVNYFFGKPVGGVEPMPQMDRPEILLHKALSRFPQRARLRMIAALTMLAESFADKGDEPYPADLMGPV